MANASGVYKRCGCLNPETKHRLGGRCPLSGQRGHGSWYFSVELPARRGRRCRLRRGGFRSRAAAKRARAYWLAGDVDPDPSLVTVGQWLNVWLETRYELRPSTRRLYTQDIRHYLRPGLGNVLLKDLTVGKVQAMFTKLLRSSGAGSKPLSGDVATYPWRAARRAQRRDPAGAAHAEPREMGRTAVGSSTSSGDLDRRSGGGVEGHRSAAGGRGVDRRSDRPIPGSCPR